MTTNHKIFEKVKLGKNVIIEDFCLIGKPPKSKDDNDIETIIGDNAIIRSHTVIYAGNKIGDNFQTGHSVVIREGNEIGNNVSIGTLSCIEHQVQIGNGVRIHSQVFVPEFSILKDNCWLGPNVVLTNAKYPLSKNVKENLVGPTINEYAKIGANSTLLPGINIGKHCILGAGSVVVKDIPAYKIAFGNPAIVVSDIRENKEYEINDKD